MSHFNCTVRSSVLEVCREDELCFSVSRADESSARLRSRDILLGVGERNVKETSNTLVRVGFAAFVCAISCTHLFIKLRSILVDIGVVGVV